MSQSFWKQNTDILSQFFVYISLKGSKFPKKVLPTKKKPGFDGLKIPKRLFFVFKLSTGKKSIECDAPDLLEAICGHYKPVFPRF